MIKTRNISDKGGIKGKLILSSTNIKKKSNMPENNVIHRVFFFYKGTNIVVEQNEGIGEIR